MTRGEKQDLAAVVVLIVVTTIAVAFRLWGAP